MLLSSLDGSSEKGGDLLGCGSLEGCGIQIQHERSPLIVVPRLVFQLLGRSEQRLRQHRRPILPILQSDLHDGLLQLISELRVHVRQQETVDLRDELDRLRVLLGPSSVEAASDIHSDRWLELGKTGAEIVELLHVLVVDVLDGAHAVPKVLIRVSGGSGFDGQKQEGGDADGFRGHGVLSC